MSKLKENIAYQTAYQLLNTCLPLLTSPYLARVLGASQQGVFSYTQSVVNYFTLFAMLGMVNYGTRAIAECNKDKKKISVLFWNIYVIQLFASLMALAIYIVYISFICRDNVLIVCIQGLYILGSFIDVNWLFFGVEKFEITVKRSMIVRITSFISILLFVNKPEDLWIYTVIMAGSTVVSNGILWWFVPRIVDLAEFKEIRVSKVLTHVKPVLVLFVPLMAMSVYHVMDKTMLGVLSTYEQTGFYYNADKVINIPISIINGIGTVMLPRMSALVETGNEKESKKLFNISVEMIVLVSTAMAFGISAIANEFTPLFFGDGFEPCILLIIVLSPVLIIKSLSQTSRMQYLIPNHQENIFIQSVFAGAFTNFVVNICLISKFGALGAVVGTLIAELVTCIWQYVKMKENIAVGKILSNSVLYICFGIIMFVLVRLLAQILPNGIIGIFIEICAGGLIYIGLCVSFWIMTKNPMMQLVKSVKHRGGK